MSDKTQAKTDSGQPINVTISQPDRVAEGAQNMIKARELLDEAEKERATFEVGGKTVTSDEVDAAALKAERGQ